jgi:hypothetical protein
MSLRPLDVATALRMTLAIFWRDFAPIILLGLAFVTLPAIAMRVVSGSITTAPDPALGTLAETVRWLLVMIFLCAVTGGVLSGARTPSAFIRAGLDNMQPGLVVALIIGVLLVSSRIVIVLLSALLPGSGFGSLLFPCICVAAFALWVLAIPAALVERKLPLLALRRSAELTRGNRWRLAGMAVIIVLALLPPVMLVRWVVFGSAATPVQVAEIAGKMTIVSPGLWIGQLTNLLIFGALSVVPAALYLILVGGRRA